MNQKTYRIAIGVSKSRSAKTAFSYWGCNWVEDFAQTWNRVFGLHQRSFDLEGLDAEIIMFDMNNSMTDDEFTIALDCILAQSVQTMRVDDWETLPETDYLDFEELYYTILEETYKWR